MKQTVTSTASTIALLLVGSSSSLADAPPPKVDAKGFIDVWQLREDVAAVEPLIATDDTDRCFPEESEEYSPTKKEQEQAARASAACEARVHASYAAYQKARAALNAAWLPLIREAIQRGDRVAEVILRLCDTTAVLDRAGIESTCDQAAPRRDIARARLKKIGFVPAFDLGSELVAPQGSGAKPDAESHNQAVILERTRAGALAFEPSWYGGGSGNIFKTPQELALKMRWAVIEAASQDAPAVFTVTSEAGDGPDGWAGNPLHTLRLNRKPLTSGFMTWGPASHYSGGAQIPTGSHYWRASPLRLFDANDQRSVVVVSGPGAEPPIRAVTAGAGNPEFERELSGLLADIDSSIKRYLADDPRWGVFLLHRIGHYEWEPAGLQSKTDVLDAGWEGKWALEKEARDWTKPMTPAAGSAVIQRNGDAFQITIAANSNEDPLMNVDRCALRYSGGSTYLPMTGPAGQNPSSTVFGYMGSATHIAGAFDVDGQNAQAVAPLDPAKRYRQVLMLCPKGESLESPRVRFLLIAADTLIEVGAANPFSGPLAVRHYQRQK